MLWSAFHWAGPSGAQTFINKGTNGHWQGVLPEANSVACEAGAVAELGRKCADWLKSGRLG
ncbi:MAG: hypothetical protein NTX73_14980 [Rhodobacterales bacterium]|nr:hypothetical protein [Rhodobacterales bacterium]